MACATACTLLLASWRVAEADGDPIRLTPKWKVGERVSVKLVTTDRVSRSSSGTDEKKLLNTRTLEYEDLVGRVRGGLAEQTTRTYRRFESQRAFEDQPIVHAKPGREVECTRVDGLLQPREEIYNWVLDPMRGGADWSWVLPDKAVSPGDTWTVKAHGLSMGAVHMALASGVTRCELVRIQEGVAHIAFRKEGEEFSGEVDFSLNLGRVTKGQLSHVGSAGGMTAYQDITFELTLTPKAEEE